MRRINLLIILLLIALLSYGFSYQGGRVPAAGSGTTCSGNYGYTSDGIEASAASAGKTLVLQVAFDCTASANDTTINVRLKTADTTSREVVLLIYADNAGEPGALVWEGDPMYNVAWSSTTWVTDTVDVELSGTHLWIGITFEASSGFYYYSPNSPAKDLRLITNAGTFPDVDANWDVGNDTTSEYGIAAYLSY